MYTELQIAITDNNGPVQMTSIFTYGFEKAKIAFTDTGLITLSNFDALILEAKENGFLDDNETDLVLQWNKDPEGWGPKNGF